MIDETIGGGLGAANFALEQGIERPLHIARGERAAIVKRHAAMEVEDVGQRIGNLPALGQPGLHVEMLIASEQRVEEKLVNALRLRVDPNSRIEIRRTALNNHDQRVGIGSLGAGEERQQACTEE